MELRQAVALVEPVGAVSPTPHAVQVLAVPPAEKVLAGQAVQALAEAPPLGL